MIDDRVLELEGVLSPDDLAANIVQQWDNWNNQRRTWLDEKMEIRNYVFATDTATTSNANSTGFKTSTTSRGTSFGNSSVICLCCQLLSSE